MKLSNTPVIETALPDTLIDEPSAADQAWLEQQGFTLSAEPVVPAALVAKAIEYAQGIYGIDLQMCPAYFVTSGLGAFAGACCLSRQGGAVLLLRSSFMQSDRWLWYDSKELLAHELCHAGRSGLESYKYEEVMAYRCSTSRVISYWGGLFRQQSESTMLVCLAFTYFLFSLLESVIFGSLIIRFIPLLLFSAYLSFLMVRHVAAMGHFKRATEAADRLFQNSATVLYECTDAEIERLASFRENVPSRAVVQQAFQRGVLKASIQD